MSLSHSRPAARLWLALASVVLLAALGMFLTVARSGSPTLGLRDQAIDFTSFSLPIDAAWIEKPDRSSSPSGITRLYMLGRSHRLTISDRRPAGGAPEYPRSAMHAVVATLAQSGWHDARLTAWTTEDIGDRRWRCATISGADTSGRPLLQQAWALGTDTHLIEIVLSGPVSGRGGIEASVRRSLAALQTSENLREASRIPTLLTVRGSRDPYEFLIPDSWSETTAPEILHADRFFVRGNDEAVVVRLLPDYFRDDRPDDLPRAYDRYLRAEFNAPGVEAREWTPAESIMVQGTEWLHARSLVPVEGKGLVRDHWCFRYDRRLYDFVVVGVPDPDEPGAFDRDARRVIESFRIPPPQDDPALYTGREVAYTISVPRDWVEIMAPNGDRMFEYDFLDTLRISITRPVPDDLRDAVTRDFAALASDPGFAAGWTDLRFDSVKAVEVADISWTTATYHGGMAGAPGEMSREHWLLSHRKVLYEIVFIYPSSLAADDPRRGSFMKAVTSFRPAPQ